MQTLFLDIVTPQKKVFSEEVNAVYVPTNKGTIGVLPRHMPLLSLLSEGEIKITTDKQEVFLAIGEGFMEVEKGKVQILVSRAYQADELNEAEIKKAQASARDILSKKIKDSERMQAYALLRRSILEMKVVTHRRSQKQRNSSLPPTDISH